MIPYCISISIIYLIRFSEHSENNYSSQCHPNASSQNPPATNPGGGSPNPRGGSPRPRCRGGAFFEKPKKQ